MNKYWFESLEMKYLIISTKKKKFEWGYLKFDENSE